jgi:hypothetical protein
VVSVGGGGSNQIVATIVHAKKFGVQTGTRIIMCFEYSLILSKLTNIVSLLLELP